MERRITPRARHRAVLAGIARREWLLQMLALGAAAGYRRSDDPAYARGNTLVMTITNVSNVVPDEWDLDPLYCPRLAAKDANGDLEPQLAHSWEHSPDYREWTYHLRTDVRWSDGVPVTAHDVKFTLDLLSHPDVAQYIFESVTVLDDFTVKVRAGGLFGGGAQDDITYFPKHVLQHLEPKKYYDWDFWLHPTVSAGPYSFVRYLPETMMEFEANPTHYLGKPKIERLVYKFVGEAGLTELLSGNVDVVERANPAQIPVVAKDPRFRVYHHASGTASNAIFWKCDHPLFRDARVRRALTLAIDRRALLGLLNLPSDLSVTDGIFTERQFRRRQLPEPLPYDPVQADALLKAAGWQDRDGDGVREQEGRPFRFTALTRGDQGYGRVAVYVQAQLRQLGVQMEVEFLDPAAVKARRTAGDFEAVFELHFGVPAEPNSGYLNPEAVRLIDQARATADPDELDGICSALTEIFRADLPVTRLVPFGNTTFAHRRVEGLSRSTYGSTYAPPQDLWLENER